MRQLPKPAGRRRFERARIVGAWATATTIFALGLIAIFPFLRPRDPATEALAAMQNANTWHISGWKMKKLNRVPWEVWGRRKPFFYYEKLGDRITYDDGHYRTEVIPQDAINSTEGIVVKTAFEPPGYGDGEEYTFRMSGWRRNARPKRTTAQDYIFETIFYDGGSWGTGLTRIGTGLPTTGDLYVNKRTLYPERYQELMSVDKSLPPVTVQDFKIELNKDLPQNIAAPSWPAGSIVMDTTVPHDTSKVPKENVAYKDGFSAQLTPLAMDKSGDVLFRVRGWFGNTRLTSGSFVQFWAQMPQSEWVFPRSPWPYHDNQSRDYVITLWPTPPISGPSGDELFLFSPAAPIKTSESLPKTMTISLWVGAYLGGRPLLGRDISWTVPLASTPIQLNFDGLFAKVDPDWRKHWLGYSQGTLPAAVDDARSTYWLWQAEPNYRSPAMLQMVKWEERAVADSVPVSHQANLYREMLANDYHNLHEYQNEQRVRREIVPTGEDIRRPGISARTKPKTALNGKHAQ